MRPPGRRAQGRGISDRCVRVITRSKVDPASNAGGFTLIEIMVVVLVIGVLLAIAIPSFLSTKDHAMDRSAQANLRSAFANAKALAAEDDSYGAVTPAALAPIETSLRFVSGNSTSPHIVSVASTDAFVVLAARSDSKTCFAIADAPKSVGTLFAALDVADCDAAAAPALPATVPSADHATVGGGWANGF